MEDHGNGDVVGEISREIVGIHSRYYGRGPTKAKTIWRSDIVVCVLEEIFTKAKQMLIDAGRFEQVRRTARHSRTRSNRSSGAPSRRRPASA